MRRAILLVLLGTILGGAAASWYLRDASKISELRVARIEAANSLLNQIGAGDTGAELPELLLSSRNTGDRAMLVLVAARADAATLNSLIRDAALLPKGASQQFALEILMSRYAEIDPYDAIELTLELRLENNLLATIYTAWADSDPRSALRSLETISDPEQARIIAMSILAALGGDRLAAESVAGSLPPSLDPVRFKLDVIAMRAETSPQIAFDDALAITDEATRARALMRIAPVWAQQNPVAALAAGALLEDWDKRWRFQGRVVRDWAREDPAAVLQYFGRLGEPTRQEIAIVNQTYDLLAAHDPAGLLQLAEQLPARERRRAQSAAFGAWAKRDPHAALAALEQLPASMQQRQLVYRFAEGFGEADLDAALLWAGSLESREPAAVAAILGGLARSDPGRALQYALASDNKFVQAEALQRITMRAVYEGGDPRQVADTVLQLQDISARESAIETLTQMWGQEDPQSALQWMIAHADRVDPKYYTRLGRELASSDPEAAASMTNEIPASARGEWLESVAQGYAMVDPLGALNWIGRFQGEPEYERTLAAAAQFAAQHDPQAVLALIGTVQNSGHAASVAGSALQAWSRTNPVAAAFWAQSQTDEQIQSVAVRSVARQWARQDSVAATRWVLEMAPGSTRDDALTALLFRDGESFNPDLSLFDSFSSDTARQQAAIRVSMRVRANDPATARQILDKYVTDPTLRGQAEQVWLRN